MTQRSVAAVASSSPIHVREAIVCRQISRLKPPREQRLALPLLTEVFRADEASEGSATNDIGPGLTISPHTHTHKQTLYG